VYVKIVRKKFVVSEFNSTTRQLDSAMGVDESQVSVNAYQKIKLYILKHRAHSWLVGREEIKELWRKYYA